MNSSDRRGAVILRISEFSKLSGASIKTLRYYDQLELVKPAFVDQLSGYRYYSEEQLLTIKRIASFKEQGFTLEQIKTFLEEQTPLNVMRSEPGWNRHLPDLGGNNGGILR